MATALVILDLWAEFFARLMFNKQLTRACPCLINRQVFNKQIIESTALCANLVCMPPKRDSDQPRPYGRQADHKTIKSISLDSEIAQWTEEEAAAMGETFSSYIAKLLREHKDSSVLRETPIEYDAGNKKKKRSGEGKL